MYKIFIFLILIIVIVYCFKKKDNEYFNNNIGYYLLYIPSRYNKIKEIFNNTDINPEFVKGIDKNTLILNNLINKNIVKKQWILDTNSNKKYIKPYNKGRVACHLGHIEILRKFLKSDNSFAIIFEDDIKFNTKLIQNKIDTIINSIPNNTDIVYLSYCFEYCEKIKKYNEILNYGYRPLCRHFYLVTKSGAEKIIKYTLPMFSSGDRMIGELIKNKLLNGFTVNPKFLNIQQDRNEMFKTTLDNKINHRLCMEY